MRLRVPYSYDSELASDHATVLPPRLRWLLALTGRAAPADRNCFLDSIDHTVILGQIKALAAGPLLKKGYGRIGIDGGWVCQDDASRATACVCGGVGGSYHNEAGEPVVGLKRFPNLKGLTDEAHALNVKLDFYGNSCNVGERVHPAAPI